MASDAFNKQPMDVSPINESPNRQPFDMAMDGLSDVINSLDAMVSELIRRLDPIMSPMEPGTKDPDKPSYSNSKATNHINNEIDRLAAIRYTVSNAIDALEI